MTQRNVERKLKGILAIFFLVSLNSCLQVENVELSSADLVVPEGVEGRWLMQYFGNKWSDDIAQVYVSEDSALRVSKIDAGNGSESRDDWSIRLIKTLSAENFIAVMKQKNVEDIYLGILKKGGEGDSTWSYFMLHTNKALSHQHLAAQIQEQFGFRLSEDKMGMKVKIEGKFNARMLRELVFAEIDSTRYFVPKSWRIGLQRLPEGHRYHAQLDRVLGEQDAPGNPARVERSQDKASNVGNCGVRRCATLNGRIIYRTRIPNEWWYWADGQMVPFESWPKE